MLMLGCDTIQTQMYLCFDSLHRHSASVASAFEYQVKYGVTKPLPPALKLGCRALRRPRREFSFSRKVYEAIVGINQGKHFNGIGLPVGSELEFAASLELFTHQIDEGPLNEASFVVTLFGPGIGKEHHYTLQTCVLKQRQHVHDVSSNEAHVVERLSLDFHQRAADPGRVDLDTEKITLRVRHSHGNQCVTHSESDLQHERPRAAENSAGSTNCGDVHPVVGPKRLKGPSLGPRQAPGAADEASDPAARPYYRKALAAHAARSALKLCPGSSPAAGGKVLICRRNRLPAPDKAAKLSRYERRREKNRAFIRRRTCAR